MVPLGHTQLKPQQPATGSQTAAGSAGQASTVPEPGETFRDCADCTEMVVVPDGEFKMGSGELGQREAGAPRRDCRSLCHRSAGNHICGMGCLRRRPADANTSPTDRGWGRGSRPVINVSWDDAKAFVAWISQKTGKKYRLPTEAEWEYAARAGTTSPFWWGPAAGADHANCEDCGAKPLRQSTPTGTFRPNGFGLYDTSGNAAEWVEDCWNENYRGAPTDGSAWTTGQCGERVLRGGSFASKSTFVRSPSRFRYDEDVRYYANGFRVARDLK